MAWFKPARNRDHPGDPPPRWVPISRAGRLVLVVTVIAGIVIALMVMMAKTAGAADDTEVASVSPDTSPRSGPVVLGGRIEVPSAGFALEVPEGWYAFDLSAPDLSAEMESFDRVTALAAPFVASVSLETVVPDIAAAYPDATLPFVAYAPFDGPTAGESCNMVVEPIDTESLELMVASELLGLRAMSDVEGVEPRFIDLPTGRLAMAEFAKPHPVAGELEMTAFWLLHDGRGYSLTCGDASRHADRWLAIAESIEFLPEQEVAMASPGSARSPSASPATASQRVEMPESGYAVTLPAGWVAMTAPEPGLDLVMVPETKMEPLVEALERDRGLAAGGLLQWRFGYLGIVMDEWPPLYVLPTDEEQTLGCGIEARARPPRPVDEWLTEVRSTAAFGLMPNSVAPEPVPVDLGIGRVWAVPGVTDAPGAFADVYHWLFLVEGDGLEIVVTCSALAQTDEAYWRPLIEGIEFSPAEE